jgi:hypothetical protein
VRTRRVILTLAVLSYSHYYALDVVFPPPYCSYGNFPLPRAFGSAEEKTTTSLGRFGRLPLPSFPLRSNPFVEGAVSRTHLLKGDGVLLQGCLAPCVSLLALLPFLFFFSVFPSDNATTKDCLGIEVDCERPGTGATERGGATGECGQKRGKRTDERGGGLGEGRKPPAVEGRRRNRLVSSLSAECTTCTCPRRKCPSSGCRNECWRIPGRKSRL